MKRGLIKTNRISVEILSFFLIYCDLQYKQSKDLFNTSIDYQQIIKRNSSRRTYPFRTLNFNQTL